MRITIIVVFLFHLTAFSQNPNNFGRRHSDTIPQNFMLNVPALRDHIYSGIPKYLKEGEYERKAYRFAHDNACSISGLIASGEIYSDWPELENYFNEILHKVIPDEMKNDSVIHAYVIQDGSMNAFMTPSGHTFINVGLLSYVNDEASIAGILAHELAHYYMKHSLREFIKRENGDFDQGLINTGKLSSHFSVKMESQADSLAMIWMQRSGYSIEGIITSFETMDRLEKNTIKQYKDLWELKETTHPLSSKRLEAIREFYAKNKSNLGKRFLIGEDKFNAFKEQAKPEILKIFIDDFNYDDCIEAAFRFHLYDPDNSVYVYYLMEGIRRKCYLNAEKWNKLFITDNYYDSISVDNHRHKEKMTDNLFKKFDFTILQIAPQDAVKVKARFYWRDMPKFTTYEEAFTFFYNLGQALNCHECALTNALSFTKDVAARNKLLDTYLAFDDIKHRDYAMNLKSGNIYKKLADHKMLCFSSIRETIKQGDEDVVMVKYIPDEKNVLQPIFDSVMQTQKNRTPVLLPAIKYYQLNNYKYLSELERFSFISILSKGEKTEVPILDPAHWEFFNKNGVNEIEFVNSIYYEYNGKDATAAGYGKMANMDLNMLFQRPSNTKSFQVFISSVRQIENAMMKIRYGGDEYKLKAKEDVKNVIVSNIRYELSIKEKRAKEADSNYKYNLDHY